MLLKRIVLNAVFFFFFTVLTSGLPLYGEDAKASNKNGDAKNTGVTGVIDTHDVLVAFGQAFDPNIVGALSSVVENLGPTMTVGDLAGLLLGVTGGQAGDGKENIAALGTRYPDIPLINNITNTAAAVELIRGIGAVPNSDPAWVVIPGESNPMLNATHQEEMESIRSAAMEQTASASDQLNDHQELLSEALEKIKTAVEQTPENAAQVVAEVAKLLPRDAEEIKDLIKKVVNEDAKKKELLDTVDAVVAQDSKTVVESTPATPIPDTSKEEKKVTTTPDPTTEIERDHTPTVVPDPPNPSPA